jgi:hypothetical protein
MDAQQATNHARELVESERSYQMHVEGYTPEHDDEHKEGQLTMAAIAYLLVDVPHDEWNAESSRKYWPWHPHGFKPEDPLRNLLKAAALVQAEIERRLRAGELPEDAEQ